MKKVILFTCLLLTSLFTFGQTVSIIGTFTNWASDVNMNSTDNTNWTLTYTFNATEQVKFRQNASWIVNWGNSSFPSGTGVQDGPTFKFRQENTSFPLIVRLELIILSQQIQTHLQM